MASTRLRRITDLFLEGRVLVLGDDEDGPALVWLKKLNPFEEQETRLDGQAARSDKLLELRDPEHREMRIARNTVEEDWGTAELVNCLVNDKLVEFYGLAKADVDGDEQWNEHRAYLERFDSLALDDPNTTDEQLQRFTEMRGEYNTAITTKLDERQAEYRTELEAEHSVDERHEMYFKMVKNRLAMDAYGQERRVTEIWYVVRDCHATRVDDTDSWDHTGCTHERLFNRADIATMSADLLMRLSAAIDDLQTSVEDAGNSDAPTSSSDSSERSNAAEAESSASSPEETSVGAPST